jgi:NADPH-dependent curcumin reductase CurA
VGSIAGQIAKIKGARAVGITGSDEKTRFLKEDCGFDAAVNYKTSANIRKTLKDAVPGGIDVYFDNVGGPISDAAITLINRNARIIICGQISLYNLDAPATGPRNLAYLLVHRARMEGFLVHDYEKRFDEGLRDLKKWLKEGKLIHRETITDGLENAPRAFLGLFHGENIGKQLVKVS